MEQPKLIVLGLLGTGLRYGFEMEDFARRTNMRQWAKIGMSSIYKALKDLERDGAISAQTEQSDKGPTRRSYQLTVGGRARMTELIDEALASEVSVYSERIVGLVFAPLMGPKKGKQAISASMAALDLKQSALGRETPANRDPIAKAIIDYYRAVYAAEQEAMRKVLQAIDSKQLGHREKLELSSEEPR